ncbi:hypothetical protein GBA52_009227 [Prunus armeniaca]|nr:hypothetical protein GBA52_009227 [Prunus armeniaca]
MDQLKPSPANLCPLTPLTLLERAAVVNGDCPSIIYTATTTTTTYTWSQTHRRCLQLASSISSLVKRSQVVSVVAPNTPAMYELHFAVPMSGAILNNINTRLDAHNISIILRHSESKLIFVDHLSVSLTLQALSLFPPHLPKPLLILITDNEHRSTPIPAVDNNYFLDTYENLVRKGNPSFEWVRPASEWAPMVLNYTSGTTSSPKGVVHSHRGLYIVTLVSIIDWSVPKHCVYLWTLPMFHSNGWGYPWAMAAVGGTNICLRKFDAPKIYSSIRAHNVTHMCAAPVVLNMLVNHPISDQLPHPDRSKDVIITGGENLSSVEVESVLYANPAVNEAAVVAKPDEFWGETPCAFVSLKSDVSPKPTEKEIMEYCRENLPHYMVPKTVVFKDELPKTSTGKIQKFVLREIAKEIRSSSSLRTTSRM